MELMERKENNLLTENIQNDDWFVEDRKKTKNSFLKKCKPLIDFMDFFKKYSSILPLLIIVGISPIIVQYRHVFYNDPALIATYGGSSRADFSAYYKSIIIFVSTAFLILSIYNKLSSQKTDWKKYSIFSLLGIFAILNILSAAFSGHLELAFMGAPERYEGAVMWVCYCIIAFAVVVLIDNKYKLKALICAILFSMLIACIIGAMQAFEMNPFATKWGAYIITMFSEKHSIGLKGFDRIYSTMYSPNIMGAFSAMAFPTVTALMIFTNNKKHKKLLSMFSCLAFVNVLCNYSRLSYLGAVAGAIVLLVIGFKQLKKHPRHTITMIVIYLLIAVVIEIYSDGRLSGKVSELGYEATSMTDERDLLDDIVMNKKSIDIIFIDQSFHITYNDETQQLGFLDTDMKPLEYTYDEAKSTIKFISDEYKDYSIIMDVNGMLTINARGYGMVFVYMNEQFKFVDTNLNKIIDDISFKADRWFFGIDFSDQAGSGRGFIWTRTLPMLKKAILLGYGPDTYPIHFPQNDYVGKVKTSGISLTIVDKPHNMYLQIASGSGVISLMIYLLFIAIYGIWSLKACYIHFIKNDSYNIYGVASLISLISVIGCSVANFFNDSSVSTGGYFWIFVGLGIVCCSKMNTVEESETAVYEI